MRCLTSTGSFSTIFSSVGARNLTFPTMTASATFLLIGAGLLTTVSATTHPDPLIYLYQVIFGLGLGGLLTNSVIVKLNARDEDMASAQGLLNQGRILGGNIGLAVATIILNAHLSSDLKDILAPAQIAELRHSINAIDALTAKEAAAVRLAVAAAFRGQMFACLGVACACFVACLFLWQRNPPTMKDRFPTRDARANGTVVQREV